MDWGEALRVGMDWGRVFAGSYRLGQVLARSYGLGQVLARSVDWAGLGKVSRLGRVGMDRMGWGEVLVGRYGSVWTGGGLSLLLIQQVDRPGQALVGFGMDWGAGL
jgi:hypothetical protein